MSHQTASRSHRLHEGQGFCLRLQEARQHAGYSQAQLADAAGVTRNQVSRYEATDILPKGFHLRTLCDVLRVSPSWLLYGHDDPFSGAPPSVWDELMGTQDDQTQGGRLAVLMTYLSADDRAVLVRMIQRMIEAQHGTEQGAGLLREIIRFVDHVRDSGWPDYMADELMAATQGDESEGDTATNQ